MNNHDEYHRLAPIGPDGAVLVETTSGDIRVVGWERNEVASGGRREPPRVRVEDDVVRVRPAAGGSDDADLFVPKACHLSVRSASGDVRLEGLTGSVEAQTMSGDVTANGLTGAVKVRAVSGDVTLSDCRPPALAVETVSGDAKLEVVLAPNGEYEVRSVSGDVRLFLPASQRCTVSWQSLSGDARCALPHEAQRRGWGKVDLEVNGGGVMVVTRSTSGDLTIKESSREEAAPFAPSEAEPAVGETRPLMEEQASEPFSLSGEGEPEAAPEGERMTRLEVLKAIDEGRISVSEGLQRLRELG